MAELGLLVGTLPDWLDLEFARTASAVLAIVSLVVVVAVIFVVRSVGTRLVAVVVFGGAVFGLLHYRDTLSHCDKVGCECKFFGEYLQGGGCAQSR
jgi:ABC-type dipeptide/oligopeptide/nickel transport system permease subunit